MLPENEKNVIAYPIHEKYQLNRLTIAVGIKQCSCYGTLSRACTPPEPEIAKWTPCRACHCTVSSEKGYEFIEFGSHGQHCCGMMERHRLATGFAMRALPNLAMIDRLMHQAIALGFAMFSFATTLGILSANKL